MTAIRVGIYVCILYNELIRDGKVGWFGRDFTPIICMYVCVCIYVYPTTASYLEELVHVYRSAAVEVHEVQCMLDLRQLTIGMQRLIQNRTAVPELFPRDHLQHQDVHVDIKVINESVSGSSQHEMVRLPRLHSRRRSGKYFPASSSVRRALPSTFLCSRPHL